MAKHIKSKPKSQDEKYQPTKEEEAALSRFADRYAASSPAPRLKLTAGEAKTSIAVDHPDPKVAYQVLMDSLGTASFDFVHGLLVQLANTGSPGKASENALNFMISVVTDTKPRDHLEAMLAAQMAAIHIATMKVGSRLSDAEDIPRQDSAGALFNKLARTFAAQMETLKRYRTGGEQKVTVQHVNVGEGGQAIVGNVTQAAAKGPQAKDAPEQNALADSRSSPMPILEDVKPERAARRKAK